MCGRFTSLLTPELIAEVLGTTVPSGLAMDPRYNITPTQPVLIVRQDLNGRRELVPVNWGLIPSWTKDPAMGRGLINARAETITEKPSFRSAFRHRRCIIPASGYYEWQRQMDKKQPWYIKRSNDDKPLLFAGLWERWQSPDGSELETCAVITTTANNVMQPIHDRMPVLLSTEQMKLWLDANTPPKELVTMLRPCPDDWLSARLVSSQVNNPRIDSPSCIAPL